MRKLTKPEKFVPPAEAARSLREIAEGIEADGRWVRWDLCVWPATEAEVRAAMEKKRASGGPAKGPGGESP